MLKEDFILIENVAEKDMLTILSNIVNMYADSGFTEGIQLFKNNNSDRRFLVTFKNTPDLEHFAYFVNYIYYPEGFEAFKPIVNGFYQVNHIEKVIDFKPGDWLQIYVSKNDSTYDNVSMVNTANESFLFDFGGKTKKIPLTEEKYCMPAIDKAEYALVKVIRPVSDTSQEIPKPWWKFW